jgi:hypothetical protein
MDTLKFLKQIRSIIREEIEYALDKKLNENRRKDDREVLSHGMNLVKEVQQVPKKKLQTPKTANTSIQSLLEETRRSMENSMRYDSDETTEYKFSTNDLNAFSQPHGAIPSGINSSDIAPEVAQALTRDYSALMAKINEKTGR